MVTGRPVTKALIEYNSNNLEEIMKKRRSQLSSTEEKADPENYENSIYFRWSGVQEKDGEDIAMINFIENYKNKIMRKIFHKSNWMIVW